MDAWSATDRLHRTCKATGTLYIYIEYYIKHIVCLAHMGTHTFIHYIITYKQIGVSAWITVIICIIIL